MRCASLLISVAVILATAGVAAAQQPAAQQPCPAPRKVNVGVAPGALGIPWFYGVYRAEQTARPALPPDQKWDVSGDKPKAPQ